MSMEFLLDSTLISWIFRGIPKDFSKEDICLRSHNTCQSPENVCDMIILRGSVRAPPVQYVGVGVMSWFGRLDVSDSISATLVSIIAIKRLASADIAPGRLHA